MIILPSSYLPPISYFAAILRGGAGDSVVIDQGEHYIKRSIRNRTTIMTAQGAFDLTIPVKRANTPRQPMREMQIDNSKRWGHQHWITILSAYSSSPYFEHFAPYIEPLYSRKWESLVEFNHELTLLILKLLRVEKSIYPTLSEQYISATDLDMDLRAKGAIEIGFESEPYFQVFSDRQPFAPNLSMLDLLLCEGTNALAHVGAIHR